MLETIVIHVLENVKLTYQPTGCYVSLPVEYIHTVGEKDQSEITYENECLDIHIAQAKREFAKMLVAGNLFADDSLADKDPNSLFMDIEVTGWENGKTPQENAAEYEKLHLK